MRTPDVKEFINHVHPEVAKIVKGDMIGFYIHGSLALGGFNPKGSDIDIIVVTNNSLAAAIKRELATFFLNCSNSPFPIEISFLHKEQVKQWQHPCPFDFHYSECWRERYENDLLNGTDHFLNAKVSTDTDLAAHITILHHKGICISGRPIAEVFPTVPPEDYLSAILGDYKDCLENIEANPVYCTLNLIRVFWYVKEGVISSKQEAGEWGISTFPEEIGGTIRKVLDCYEKGRDLPLFEKEELLVVKNYILHNVQTQVH